MRMLMPSHAKNVKPYKEAIPLFQRYQIEAQLDAMFTPTVTLKSGGYIVINQTEALVSIDVNSGRATREHSIEDTAYKTNLEAAEEIARQLRLRDLAGLIVIDFIDMEDPRNDRNVEKRLRDSIKNDRARVQIGKISQFGLLEMSRQRLRAGVVAGSTVPCPHCGGQGIVRSVESTTLRVLRGLEEEAQRQRAAILSVRVPTEVAIYALNQKRREIAHIESEYGLAIQFDVKDGMFTGTFEVERIGQRAPDERPKVSPVPEDIRPDTETVSAEALEPAEPEPVDEDVPHTPVPEAASPAGGKRKRRRRRGRDRASPHTGQDAPPSRMLAAEAPKDVQQNGLDLPSSDSPGPAPSGELNANGDGTGRKRRRRRRGRRGSRDNGPATSPNVPTSQPIDAPLSDSRTPDTSLAEREGAVTSAIPVIAAQTIVPNSPSEPVWSLSSDGDRPAAGNARRDEPIETAPASSPRHETANSHVETAEPSKPAPVQPSGPPRKGWWQRPFRPRE
jgi:ribonuclease E